MRTILITIKGNVQGVFYRAFAKREAEKLNLKGYAKNLDNGDVEIEVQGNEKDIQEFIKLCKKGPVGSTITAIIIKKVENRKEYSSFSISY